MLFKLCTQLSTLDLHNTEITIDILNQVLTFDSIFFLSKTCARGDSLMYPSIMSHKQFEGWESFDERRRLKHQKQLDFRVGSSGVFDEGADKY